MSYHLNPRHPVAMKLLRADERRRALATLTVEAFNALNPLYRVEARLSGYTILGRFPGTGTTVYAQEATLAEAVAVALETCKRFDQPPPRIKQRRARAPRPAPVPKARYSSKELQAMGADFASDWLSWHADLEAAARLSDGRLRTEGDLESAAHDIAAGNVDARDVEAATDDVWEGIVDVLKRRGLRP